MTSPVATQDSVLGFDRAISSLSTLINSNSLSLDAFVEGTKNCLYDAYSGLENLVSNPMDIFHASGIATRGESEPNHLVLHHEQHQEADNAVWEHDSPPELIPNNHNSPVVLEVDDPEVAGQPSTARAKGSFTLSNCARIWIGMLVAIVLSLILVPGVVLGVVTKQVMWGFALSAFIAAVIGNFAGLYYHIDR